MTSSCPRTAGKERHENFFGTSDPTSQWGRYPEHWIAYKRAFLDDCDYKRFNTRVGHGEPWYPATGKKRSDGVVVKEWPRPLASCERELDRHLAGSSDEARPCTWLGTYGGSYSRQFVLDLDNHAAKDHGYKDRHGRHVQVGFLDIEYLSRARRAFDVLLDLPTIVTTSSRSLGLNLWQVLPEREVGPELFWSMRRYLDRNGLADLEVHPMYDAAGRGNRCHRRPFGDGSFTLTSGGIIKPWTVQLGHYLRPTPPPSFPEVVEMLIALWTDQYKNWNRHGSPRPTGLDHGSQAHQIAEIRAWVARGCPALPHATDVENEVPVRRAAKAATSSTASRPPAVVVVSRLPDDLRALPRHERVYQIAREGVPCRGALNPCLLVLANHLLGLELHDLDDREQIAARVLSKFCLDKHNGHSSRLDGTMPLPKRVTVLIDDTIARAKQNAEASSFRELRKKTYSRLLRVRWLICGEGSCDQYGIDLDKAQQQTKPSLLGVPDSEMRGRLLAKPLPAEVVTSIRQLAGRKPAKAIEFLTCFCNHLHHVGGKARVNRDDFMPVFLGYKSNDKWARYTSMGIRAGLFRQSSHAIKDKQSREYTLLIDEVLGQLGLHGEARCVTKSKAG